MSQEGPQVGNEEDEVAELEEGLNVSRFFQVAPILIENLPQNILLRCRQLCRSWTQELDHQFQEHPRGIRLPFEIARENKLIPDMINYFHSAEAITKFLEEMKEHPGNPFPGRNVHVEWMPPPEVSPETHRFHEIREDYWRKVVQLFRCFGSHVYFVRFMFLNDRSINNSIAVDFWSCLNSSCNLKRLSIWGGWMTDVIPRCDPFLHLPLPPAHLCNLETFHSQRTSSNLIRSILTWSPIPANMKRLSVDTIEGSDFVLPEAVFSFVNLELLRAPLSFQDLQTFGNLARVPPLRELHISLQNMEVEPQQIIRALEPFANSLVHLSIE